MPESIKKLFCAGNTGFYFDIFGKGWAFLCVVWSFMIFQFWWGNHDWGFLKGDVHIENGFFEVRYAQHLFTVLFFDGQVFPILTLLCALAGWVVFCFLVATYFDIPRVKEKWLFLVLIVGCNPYLYILFYYVYLAFSFVIWPLIGVSALYLSEKPRKWYKFLFGTAVYILVLGSYPANMALIFCCFLARRLFFCFENKENFTECVKAGMFFCLQICVAYVCFKFIYAYLLSQGVVNEEMYNIKVRSLTDVFMQLPQELVNSVLQLFHKNSFLGGAYCLLLGGMVVFAVLYFWVKCQNKVVCGFLLLILFMASRFAFLASARVDIGGVRMELWSRLGLVLFALGVLLKENTKVIKNFLWVWGIVTLMLFIKTDFEIQKVQQFGFVTGRRFQTRLLERIIASEDFVYEPRYISLTFGAPNFRYHFFDDEYRTEEMLGYGLFFEFDVETQLFWEDTESPIIIGARIDGNQILRIDRGGKEKWADVEYWKHNPLNMGNIRYWMYTTAKQNSIYIDDKYLILVLDMLSFYKYRELVLAWLDK